MIKQICDACGKELPVGHYLSTIRILTNEYEEEYPKNYGEFCPKCFMDLKKFLEDQAKNWIKTRVHYD